MRRFQVGFFLFLTLCFLSLSPLCSGGWQDQETRLTYRADHLELKRFFLDPVFLNHLMRTKAVIPQVRFDKMYSIVREIPRIRLADGSIFRLMPASLLHFPTRTEIEGSLQIPTDLTQYAEYILQGNKAGVKSPPEVADHRLVQSPIRNQNPRNTCVAHAILAAMEVFRNVPNDLSEEDAFHLFMMNFPRDNKDFPQTCTTDKGFFISEAAKLLNRDGACEEKFWEYSHHEIDDCPDGHQPLEGAVRAEKYRIGEYRTLLDLSGIPDIKKKIALRAHDNRFVCADWTRKDHLVANRAGVGAHECFEVVPLNGGKSALKAWNGKYVCADAGLGNILVADRDNVGSWETFEIISRGGKKIALKAYNGRFVSADADRGNILVADRTEAREGETFERIDHLDRLNVKNTNYLECLLAAAHDIVWNTWILWDDVDNNGILDVKLDNKGNPLVPNDKTGRHAMLIVGYNRPRKYFIVKNSWSNKWGHHGYAFIHYDYVKAYGNDAAIILNIKPR